jgi:hypothetical protein
MAAQFRAAWADAVQHAGEHFLAHARLAGEEHGGRGGRHALQHVAGGVEGRGSAHQRRVRPRPLGGVGVEIDHARGRALGQCGAHEGLRVQVAQVFLRIVPAFDRLADDPAQRVARRAAVHLAEHDQAPEQGAHVAGGVAHLHPAGGRAAHAVGGDVFVVLAGVVPEELAFVVARIGVVVHVHHLDLDHPFERVQPGARDGGGRRVGVGPLLAHQLRVARAAHVAGAREQATRLVQADAVDQLAAQRAQGLRVQQDHALVLQPDAAVSGREKQAFAEVGHGRVRLAIDAARVKAPQGGGQRPRPIAGHARAADEVGQGDALFGHGARSGSDHLMKRTSNMFMNDKFLDVLAPSWFTP